MKNTFLYIITVLIWGSTWLAIEYQIGEVPLEVSLIYRFGAAAFLILLISKVGGLTLSFDKKQHSLMAALGLFNFGLNYLLIYHAQVYLNSAMTSVAFSLLLVINIINTRLFFGKPIPAKTWLGSAVGLSGLVVLFWPELISQHSDKSMVTGLLLVIGSALSASFGNMLSVYNSSKGLPVLQSSGFAMLYGTLFLLIIALAEGQQFIVASGADYWWSWGFLTVFGTVIAFYSYFVLLKNIGPEKTSYSIVLFPMVAVALSALFEGFVPTGLTWAGFGLIILGNLIVVIPPRIIANLFKSRPTPTEPIEDCV